LPIQLSVPIAPTPFLGDDGQRYLVYEVHATNFGARDLLLGKLDVLQDATTLASYEGTDLSSAILQSGTATGSDRRTLAAGKTSVVFIWIPVTAVPLRCVTGSPSESIGRRARRSYRRMPHRSL
jgi:hypothetical protein